MLRVVELFAGVGAQHQALKNLGIPHEVVAISEIDKYAIAAYTAIHGPVNNLGDIRKIEHLPPCDLVTYSFPCQDLSKAGNSIVVNCLEDIFKGMFIDQTYEKPKPKQTRLQV